MRLLFISILLFIWLPVSRAANSFTVNGNSAVAPTNLALPGWLSVTNKFTNNALTASRIVLSGTGKELLSSAFNEADLASFTPVTYVDNSVNGSSNVLRLLIVTATNTLYVQVTSDINNSSNSLRTLTINSTNTIYANMTIDLLGASNALRNFSILVTNGLSRELSFDGIQFTVVNGTNVVFKSGALVTNLFTYGLHNQGTNIGGFTATNPIIAFEDLDTPTIITLIQPDGDGGVKITDQFGLDCLDVNDEGDIFLGSSLSAPRFPAITGPLAVYINSDDRLTALANSIGRFHNDGSGGFSFLPLSIFSNNVSLTDTPTNFDFYGFLKLTNASGKVSIGAPDISASASNALVNIATNNITVAPGAGTLVSTSYVGGKVIYTVSDTEVASTMVMTNFVLNQVYTNTSVQPILVRASSFLTAAAVSGDCALDLMYSQTAGTGYTLLSRVAMQTLITSIAMSYTNTISGVMTNLGSYYFTNTSAGIGNSAGLVAGTGQYVIIGGGAVGPTGAAGAAGSMGISLQATNYGSTIGSGSNLLVIVETNLTMSATNTTGAGGTNAIKFDTAQPLTTSASPSFANVQIPIQLSAGGIISTNGVTNKNVTANSVMSVNANQKEVAIPNPTVGAGMPLIFNGTNGFFDTPDDGWFINDEFNLLNAAASPFWTTLVAGTGGANIKTSSTNWGECTYTNGPTAADRSGIVNPTATATYTVTNTELWCYVRMAAGIINTTTISNHLAFGLGDTFSGQTSNGVWVQMAPKSTVWQAVVANAGAVTTNSLTIAATKDEWREFIWHLDQTQTSVYFYSGNRAQNSTIWCTNTIALPTVPMNWFFSSRRMATQTSGSATNSIDHFKVWKRNLL